ncbi:hypothetical protein [Clostridium gasigenes]|uniref:hypothetical protein n=1 Tax=Clostridium gasigenes TaxID=94869 RepID=UPI001C0AE803|nr:hypothetical protein [Clostridium gasigenes]MBU3107912.1 hypothetical protein [Clostridium gasigenes]
MEKIIRTVLDILIKTHLKTKEFNKELQSIYYYKPEVAKLMDKHEEKIQSICLILFPQQKELISITDLEVASIICVDSISSTLDTIVFKKTEMDTSRLIDGCVEVIMKYLG